MTPSCLQSCAMQRYLEKCILNNDMTSSPIWNHIIGNPCRVNVTSIDWSAPNRLEINAPAAASTSRQLVTVATLSTLSWCWAWPSVIGSGDITCRFVIFCSEASWTFGSAPSWLFETRSYHVWRSRGRSLPECQDTARLTTPAPIGHY